jgi:hypothetical protein
VPPDGVRLKLTRDPRVTTAPDGPPRFTVTGDVLAMLKLMNAVVKSPASSSIRICVPKKPVFVGVPLMTPVAEFRERPGGSTPRVVHV